MTEANTVSSAPTVTACTIVARNYLPAAAVLARSYRHHHPDHRVVVAVIDGVPEAHDGVPGVDYVGPDGFGIETDTYLRMATAYSVMELATAVKPSLLRELRRDSDVVIYLDPDIEVFDSLGDVPVLAAEHSIVLTPHNLYPIPRDGREPDEAVIMGTGLFNLGFIAVGPGSEDFLDFWGERLRHDAVDAREQQLFTDQRWVDYVPSLFRHHVTRDPGLNVAYWNAWERPLTRAADGRVDAAGVPLRFVHFSGYKPHRPWSLSSHCARDPRVLLSEHPVLRELCDGYGRALREHGYDGPVAATPYRYARTPQGEPITGWMRRTYRSAWRAADLAATRPAADRGRVEPTPPHPFGPDGATPFLAWLASPDGPRQAAAGQNRLTMDVWERRADLRSAFADPLGAHAEAFRAWCHTSGVAEGELPSWALPAEPAPRRAPRDETGVNLVGYLTAELGLGEMGRIVHDALAEAGVPTASVVEDRSVSNRTDLAAPTTAGDPVFPVTLLAVNADQTDVVLGSHPEVAHDRYVIGLWAWELEDFPSWLHGAFDRVDEVWTISEFCRTAIAAHSTVPVRTIPVPIRRAPDAGREPGGPVRFLFAFDFNSVGERKNPWGLVEAFHRAFGRPGSAAARDDARLTIKAINGAKHPHVAERLRAAVAGDPRIELVERYLSVEDLDALYRSADCYVSLHRSEGFGLTVAEAMARGLPTIVTDYSGSAEFCTPDTGWAVGYTLVDVGDDAFPYHAGARWAEPDLDDAAAAMRAVADDPAEARRRGVAAREHVLATRSSAIAATWLRDAVSDAHQRWRSRAAVTSAAPAGPLAPLAAAREALRWKADTDAPSRLPVAPALRRAVLRAVDHYDVHQRAVQSAVLDGVEASLGGLDSRLRDLRDAVTGELGETRAAADVAAERITDRFAELDRALAATRAAAEQATAGRAAEQAADRIRFTALDDRLAAIETRINDEAKRGHDGAVERDRRIDRVEHDLTEVKRVLDAVVAGAEHPATGVPPGAVAVLCDAGVLFFPPDDRVVRPWVEHHRSWEADEAALLARLAADRPGTVLDVGAHVGYHAVRIAQRVPGTRVLAVEPTPSTVELLRANTASLDAVEVLAVAAWDQDTTVSLRQVEVGNSGDYRVSTVGATPADSAVDVPAVRLDGLDAVRAQPVTLVKTDLQGRDHRALTGLRAVLDRDRPEIVCEFAPDAIEELGDDPVEVIAGYRALGYVPNDLDGNPFGSDVDLVAAARAAEPGFLTLWLRPVAGSA